LLTTTGRSPYVPRADDMLGCLVAGPAPIRRVYTTTDTPGDTKSAIRRRASGDEGRVVLQRDGVRGIGDAVGRAVDHGFDHAAGQFGRGIRRSRRHEARGLPAQFLIHADEWPHHPVVLGERGLTIIAPGRQLPGKHIGARLEPWPDMGEAQYAAAPTRATRSRVHSDMSI